MRREESLGKRLLNYLGLEYELREVFDSSGLIHVIDVFQPKTKIIFGSYNSWRNLLFGCRPRRGLCNLCNWLCSNDNPWYEYKLKAFQFENLEELEMQLSVRGFQKMNNDISEAKMKTMFERLMDWFNEECGRKVITLTIDDIDGDDFVRLEIPAVYCECDISYVWMTNTYRDFFGHDRVSYHVKSVFETVET